MDWRFLRPKGPLPRQLARTKSPVRFSPRMTNVRSFPVSAREMQEKRAHWLAIHGRSAEQYAQQELEELGAPEAAEDEKQQQQQQQRVEEAVVEESVPPVSASRPADTSDEDRFSAAAVRIQTHRRGLVERRRHSRRVRAVRRAEAAAATQIAAVARGRAARSSVALRRQALPASRAEDPSPSQPPELPADRGRGRGWVGAEEGEEEEARRHMAATRLQAVARGRAARRLGAQAIEDEIAALQALMVSQPDSTSHPEEGLALMDFAVTTPPTVMPTDAEALEEVDLVAASPRVRQLRSELDEEKRQQQQLQERLAAARDAVGREEAAELAEAEAEAMAATLQEELELLEEHKRLAQEERALAAAQAHWARTRTPPPLTLEAPPPRRPVVSAPARSQPRLGLQPLRGEERDDVVPPQRTKSWEDTWAEQGADIARQQVRRHDAATRLQAVQRGRTARRLRTPSRVKTAPGAAAANAAVPHVGTSRTDEAAAAARIQARYRGRAVRTALASSRRELAEAEAEAQAAEAQAEAARRRAAAVRKQRREQQAVPQPQAEPEPEPEERVSERPRDEQQELLQQLRRQQQELEQDEEQFLSREHHAGRRAATPIAHSAVRSSLQQHKERFPRRHRQGELMEAVQAEANAARQAREDAWAAAAAAEAAEAAPTPAPAPMDEGVAATKIAAAYRGHDARNAVAVQRRFRMLEAAREEEVSRPLTLEPASAPAHAPQVTPSRGGSSASPSASRIPRLSPDIQRRSPKGRRRPAAATPSKLPVRRGSELRGSPQEEEQTGQTALEARRQRRLEREANRDARRSAAITAAIEAEIERESSLAGVARHGRARQEPQQSRMPALPEAARQSRRRKEKPQPVPQPRPEPKPESGIDVQGEDDDGYSSDGGSSIGSPPPLLALPWAPGQTEPAPKAAPLRQRGLEAGLAGVAPARSNRIAVLQPHEEKFQAAVQDGLLELCSALPELPIWAETIGRSGAAVGATSGARRARWETQQQQFFADGMAQLNTQWLRRGGTLTLKKARLLVGDTVDWLEGVAAAQMRRAVNAPFEAFLAHAQRAIQDRTGAEEASVPIEDQDAVKHAHDALLSAASAALAELLAGVAKESGAVGSAVRAALAEPTRQSFSALLLESLLGACDFARVLEQTRAVLALPSWRSEASEQEPPPRRERPATSWRS